MLGQPVQIGMKPLQQRATESIRRLQTSTQYGMVDSCKCSRQVQEDQCCNITTVDGLKDVGKLQQGGGFRGVARSETRLKWRQQIGRPQVIGELLGDEPLQQLWYDRQVWDWAVWTDLRGVKTWFWRRGRMTGAMCVWTIYTYRDLVKMSKRHSSFSFE